VHPDEVVALGAAIQGAALVDDKQEMILLDVTPHALGIMTSATTSRSSSRQNTTVPTQRTKVFTTSRDNQTAVKILVMQGDSSKAEDNELLGEFILTGLRRRAPRAQVEIEVAFEINADGIVSVRAKDLETGLEQSIQVTATSGLTRDEIEAMIDDAKDELVDRRTSEEFEARSRRPRRRSRRSRSSSRRSSRSSRRATSAETRSRRRGRRRAARQLIAKATPRPSGADRRPHAHPPHVQGRGRKDLKSLYI
jgi:molecular chaperone DnaK